MSQPEPPSPPRRAWPVFAVYVGAIAAILVFTAVAVDVLTALYPDVPDTALLQSLPGLIAGSLAASTALLASLLLARSSRPRSGSPRGGSGAATSQSWPSASSRSGRRWTR